MKKLLNKKGFTLIEMLIVVAIIVVLAAISIPTFSGATNKAKKAADEANFRAAKSVAQVYALDETKSQTGNFYYDVTDGQVKALADGATVTGYGSCTKHVKADGNKPAYIKITFTDGIPSVFWSAGGEICE